MTDEKKTLKFQMMMSPKEAEILDDWMFKNRVRSRAEAIRRLTQIALAIEPIAPAMFDTWQQIAKVKGSLSTTLLDAWANVASDDVEKLLNELDSPASNLSAPVFELGIQTLKVNAIFSGLKEGRDIEDTLREIEANNVDFDKTSEVVKRVWPDKEPSA